MAGNAGYLSRLAARRRTLRHRPEATEMRFPDVTPGGGGAAADPATPVGKADDALALAHGDDLTVESVLQSLSPTSVKSVISRAAADAVAEVRPGFTVRSIPPFHQVPIRRTVTHRLPSLPSPTKSQLQSRLVAAERAQHAAEDRARAAKRDAAAAAKAHDAERRRWQTHFDRVQRETELVKVKVDAVKAEHASNLRELVRRNEDLAAVGEALEREREARARCEERLRKAQKIERDALEKVAASEDSLELALATNAERAAKAARRARKSAMDAASGAGGWDEAYADVKEELDALRETLRRREADAAELSRRADAAEARALAAENAALAADANALANEVKELRASQSSMAHEVAMEVTARVVEEVGGSTPTKASAAIAAPSAPGRDRDRGIDPAHHALLVGQSHRNRAEIERLTRLYDERGEQLRELTEELKGERDARADAEGKARAAEATTLRLMSLNKNLLDSYQKLLDEKANDAVGQGRAEAEAADHGGGGRRRASHLPRVATPRTARRRRRRRRSRDRRVRRVRRRPRIPAAEVELERTEGHAARLRRAAVAAALRDAADDARRHGVPTGVPTGLPMTPPLARRRPLRSCPRCTTRLPRGPPLAMSTTTSRTSSDVARSLPRPRRRRTGPPRTRPWPRCWTACEARWRRWTGSTRRF